MVGDGVERRLAAILSMDVVGYSRLMAVDEVGTLGRLTRTTGRTSVPEEPSDLLPSRIV